MLGTEEAARDIKKNSVVEGAERNTKSCVVRGGREE